MRELKVVGLDVDGRHIVCELEGVSDKLTLRVDDRLRAAVRGDAARANQTEMEVETKTILRPREIQARIRAGASVEQLARTAGVDVSRIMRFAHPVLLERTRAAELATAAHPVLESGPSVLTLLEIVTTVLIARGLDPDASQWDAWRNEDGRWTVQVAWQAGHSDNIAHFRFVPGAHGGTVTAADDAASELIDPNFDRPLRPLAAVAQLPFSTPEPAAPEVPKAIEVPALPAKPAETAQTTPVMPVAEPAAPMPAPKPAARQRAKRVKPTIPAWEDVLLGVRSSGDR
ncbi:MAG TPA: septation protein SepH [Mycobacterium sp.]|nr:septation protein SepH [Mycobacterium sp.]